MFLKTLNDKPYDFSTDETINIDSDKNAYAKNYTELKSRWRLQMKLSILATVVDKEKLEADKKEKDSKYIPKSIAQLEKEARETTQKSLNDYFDFVEN